MSLCQNIHTHSHQYVTQSWMRERTRHELATCHHYHHHQHHHRCRDSEWACAFNSFLCVFIFISILYVVPLPYRDWFSTIHLSISSWKNGVNEITHMLYEQHQRRRRWQHTQQRSLCLLCVIEIDIRFWAFLTTTTTNSRKNLIQFNNGVIAGEKESEPRIDTIFFSLFLYLLCLPMWNWNKIQLHCEAFASTFLPFFHSFSLQECIEWWVRCGANCFICTEYKLFFCLHPVSHLSVPFFCCYCTSVRRLREFVYVYVFSFIHFIAHPLSQHPESSLRKKQK